MKLTFHSLVRPAAVLAFSFAIAACGGGSETNDSGTGDAATHTGNAAHGQTLVESSTYVCGSCHTGSHGTLAGGDSIPGQNLTPDNDTGLGTWTDAQIIAAIRTGVDDEGHQLCATMLRYSSMSDSDAADIVAYLRSLTAVHNQVGECSP